MSATKVIQRFRRDESGFALVLALACIVALGTAVSAMSYYTTSNYHSSVRSSADQTALALAEAGLNVAFSTLQKAPSPTLDSAISTTPVPDIPITGGVDS